MRSAVAIAAFAATALAIPYVKRDEVVVTNIDVDVVTDIVTITATGPPPAVTTTASAVGNQAQFNQGNFGHGFGQGGPNGPFGGWTPVASAEPTTTEAPPAPTTPTTTYVPPPPPTTTSTTTPVWVAPSVPAVTQAPQEAQAWATGEATGTTDDGASVFWTQTEAAYTAYSDIVVAHHNFHRANHSNTSPLVWNETLAQSAQALADTCVYGHNTDINGGGYGQNIAAGVDMNNVSLIITDLFYNGEEPWFAGQYGGGDQYNQASPDMSNFEHWGHFSQIVWKDTVSVACATSNCTAGGLGNVGSDTPAFFTVCNYFPSGNWGGEYGANIGDSLGLPSIDWNAS